MTSRLSEQQLIQAMVENPKLIERPIVVANGQARIGRPPEAVLEILVNKKAHPTRQLYLIVPQRQPPPPHKT